VANDDCVFSIRQKFPAACFRQLKRGKDDNRIRNRANMPIAVSSATFADRSLTSVGKNALMPRPKS
jgi:hypothetical protein